MTLTPYRSDEPRAIMTCAITNIIDRIDLLPEVDQHRLSAVLNVNDAHYGPRITGVHCGALPDVIGGAVANGVEAAIDGLTIDEARKIADDLLDVAELVELLRDKCDTDELEDIGVRLVTGSSDPVTAESLVYAAYLCMVDAAERSERSFGVRPGGLPALHGALEDMEAALKALLATIEEAKAS